MNIYLIGSLRNPRVPHIANELRQGGFTVFDDWFAAGAKADEEWQAYEQGRGHTLATALLGFAANHVFEFDREHLERADIVVLVMPCGKSGHLELGVALGQGKRGYILLDREPERFDVMYKFAHGVFSTTTDLLRAIKTS